MTVIREIGWHVAGLMVLAGAGAAAAADDAPGARDYFPVPHDAVVRPLGLIPHGVCDPSGAPECAGQPDNPADVLLAGGYPLDVPGLGVPVGGVGGGSFMINQSGTFGPWTFGGEQNGTRWENRILPQAAFHLREQLGDQPANLRTLAADGPQNVGPLGPVADRSWGNPLPAWNVLKPGEARYAALYPFGWMQYKPFRTDVSMRFFSPIVPHNDQLTSMPVAYFDVKLANHTNVTDRVSVMFTMPNAPAHVGSTPASVRTGFFARADTDPVSGVTGVTLGAEDPANTPDEAHSEWSLAARPQFGQTATYTTSWNANGDGSDIYAPFRQTGQLGNKPVDGSFSAGAVAVSVTLLPGQSTIVSFALSWDFPQITYGNLGTIWMRRYTDFYGARETAKNGYVEGSYKYHQAFNIAKDALAAHDETLAAVNAWYQPILAQAAYPPILRTAALNQLYQVAFKMPLWEGGLVSNSVAPTLGQRLGTALPGTHLFFEQDASGGGNSNMGWDVGSYGYLTYNLLFPTIERDRLLGLAQAIMVDPNGNPDTGAGADPYISWGESSPPVPGTTQFIDVPSKKIYRLYAYALLQDDPLFLSYVYPAMKKELAFLQGTILAGQNLPDTPIIPPGYIYPVFPNTYDVIPTIGRDAYDSQLYLLALEVMIAAGQKTAEAPSVIAAWKQELATAKAEFEQVFWDPKNSWYRYTEYTSGTATHIDTLFAQHVAERLHLPDLLDIGRYFAQLSQYDRFLSRDTSGQVVGAANMALPRGVTTWPILLDLFGVTEPRQETMVWVGTNYFEGAEYYQAGSRFDLQELKNHGIQMASGVARQVWADDKNGFVFDTPEAWQKYGVGLYLYPGYERPLAIWDLIDTIKPVSIGR